MNIRFIAFTYLAPSFVNAMLIVSVVLIELGVMTLIFDARNENGYNSVEDAFEWILILLLQINLLLGYRVWQRPGWTLAFRHHDDCV